MLRSMCAARNALRKPICLTDGEGAVVAWLGESRRYLVVGEQTLGRIAIAREHCDPAQRPVREF